MYFFQKSLFGRLSAFTGAFVFLYAPFRFSNIFVRAAIGDATIFIFPPLLFLAIFKLRGKKYLNWKWISLAALSLSCMVLSHAMVFLFYFLVFIAFMVFSLFFVKNKKKFITSFFLIILFALSLSSFYFVPSFIERADTRFVDVMKAINLKDNYVLLKELIYSPWRYGTQQSKIGGMSFQIGFAQWASFFLATITLLGTKLKKRFSTFAVFNIIIFSSTIFLMLKQSSFVWNIVRKYAMVDFPWRILSVSIFSASILAGFSVFAFSKKSVKYFITSFIILLAIFSNRNHTRVNKIQNWPLSFYLKLETTTNSHDEYLPSWVPYESVKREKFPIEFPVKEATLKVFEKKSNFQKYQIDTPSPGRARINTIYYPGWKVYVDGKERKVSYDHGLIEFELSRGNHEIIAKFTETPLRRISNYLSLLSFCLAIYLLIKYRYL